MKPCIPVLNPVDVVNLGDSVTMEIGLPLPPVEFVMVGGNFQLVNDSLVVSPDGDAWSGLGPVFGTIPSWLPPPPLMLNIGVAVHCDGVRWMAAGVEVGPMGPLGVKVFTSLDGYSWSQVASPLMLLITGVASNGTMWVVSGDASFTDAYASTDCPTCDALAYSTNNGLTWTSIDVTGIFDGLNYDGLGKKATDVLWNGSIWVASGQGGTGHAFAERVTKAYSYDGIKWTPVVTTGIVTTAVGGKLAWNGATWLHAVTIGNQTALESSADGITWAPVVSPSLITVFGSIGSIRSLAWNGTRWVAVGGYRDDPGGSYIGGPIIAYSSDGINWVDTAQTVFGTKYATNTAEIYDVISNGAVTVAVGDANCSIRAGYSLDGITWSAGSYPNDNGSAMLAVYCCGGDNV